jgi:hypothetical protein
MPDIGNYTATATLVLGEAGKYFVLLLFSVLAIRLWRWWAKSSGSNRIKCLILAGVVTGMAVTTGYFSMCHSLGKLYAYYGMSAFRENRLPQASALFALSLQYWKNADALGQNGVCLLLSGQPDRGLALLSQAKSLRQGNGAPFEDFYEGLYFFTQGQPGNSAPLLAAASADATYRWSAIKLLAVMELEANRPAEAARLMQPFMQADVTESDQAYVIAALKLAAGRKAEALAVLDKIPAPALTPMWQMKFEKLRAEINR